MARTPAFIATLAGVLLLVGSITGCRTPPPVYVVEAVPEEVVVPCPPPRPRLEVPPEPPDESYVWQPGYWNWDGEEYDWVDGCWVEPRPGYFFVEASFAYVGGAWRYRPPYWRRHRHHRHHRGRDQGIGPKVAHGGDGPFKHRAPPAEPAKHRAPPAGAEGDPAKHAAPGWSKGVDPDASESRPPMAYAARPERPGGLGPVKVNPDRTQAPIQEPKEVPDEPGPQGPKSIHIGHQTPDGEPIDIVHDQSPSQLGSLRQRPDFRGMRDGRMVFGDDPAGSPRTYQTDSTGAIVLAPGARTFRPRVRPPEPRGLVVHIPVRQGRTISEKRGQHPRPGLVHPWPRQQAARRQLINRPVSSGWRRTAPRVSPQVVRSRSHSIRSSAPRVAHVSRSTASHRSFHHRSTPVRMTRSVSRSWSRPARSVRHSAPRARVSRSRSVSRSYSARSSGRGGRSSRGRRR